MKGQLKMAAPSVLEPAVHIKSSHAARFSSSLNGPF